MDNGQATSGVRQHVDVNSLERYIKQAGLPIDLPISLKQFKQGQSNPTYLITDCSGKKYVLRKKPPGTLISKKAHAIEREYNVLNKLKADGVVPVPNVFSLCEDTSVLDTPFYIMEFLSGRIFVNIRLLGLSMQERVNIWFSAIETLASLHKVNLKKAQLESHGKAGDYYPRQLSVLLKISEMQSRAANVEKLYRFEEIKKIFNENPIPDEVTLVHGDYKIDNLVFAQDSSKVLGILDWELSTIGHPLFDLSNLLQPFYTTGLPVTDNPACLAFLPLENDPGLPENFVETLLQKYCELTGRPYPIPKWKTCVAFSFFRVSVIAQGVAARAARGQASSQNADGLLSFAALSKTMFKFLPRNPKI
ncbi:hypothetical protein DSO57_1017196 [Entomophthora muscae]|uniref:Uncharacterized protein n=1 Tax=Entomophthora muscae TaxID=34485 RepID=A0ACC2SHE5_9FUNG|nr:hypothetical protein DSO57_1017196 [Entomophthora muscae]